MSNKNTLSKFLAFLGAVTLGFSISNAATNDTTNVILSKQDCFERICEWTNIGIGGAYYNANGENTSISGYAGYVSLFGKVALKQRLQFGANIAIGGGNSDLGGSAFPNGAKSNANLMVFDFALKAGANITSKESPIFINILGGLDMYSTNKEERKFQRSLGLAGIEIEGEKPLSAKLSVMYGASYSFVVAGTYILDKQNTKAQIPFSTQNYAISANVGISYEIERGISTFVRAIGKYQHLNASQTINANNINLSMPAINNTQAMIEFGIGF
ncbi:hypothetical protein [Helicobacter sp. 23-1046]